MAGGAFGSFDAATTTVRELERAFAALAAHDLDDDDPERLMRIARRSLVQAWEHARLIPGELLEGGAT